MALNLSLQPIDYSSMLTDVDLGARLSQSYKAAEQQKVVQAQLARQLKQQRDLDAARDAALKNPSVETFNALMVLDPQNHEAIKAAWQAKDADTRNTELADLSAVRGYLRAGKPEEARKVIQRRIEADKAAGQDATDDEQFLGLIDEDGEEAAGFVDFQIAAVLGPDKWAEAFGKVGESARADAELPSKIAQNVAGATQAQATAAKTLSEAREVAPNAASERSLNEAKKRDLASQVQYRADLLALERDKLETNVGLELDKLTAKGVEISPASEKAMTDAVIAAESNRQLGARAQSLAERIETATLSGGWASWLAQNAGSAYGSPSLLRKEYAALINSQAVKNLPPGPASDRDIQLALKGFPPPTANAQTMASFLRGMAKMQAIAANRENARADWISENGNLGRARRDLTVNGVKVPAGATYADFSASQAAIERREAAPERSYMRFGQ